MPIDHNERFTRYADPNPMPKPNSMADLIRCFRCDLGVAGAEVSFMAIVICQNAMQNVLNSQKVVIDPLDQKDLHLPNIPADARLTHDCDLIMIPFAFCFHARNLSLP